MLLLACACTGGKYETFSGYAQGGTYRVKVNMQGVRVSPETVAAAIDSLLEAIDFSISGYNRNSLLSKRNAGEEIVPDRYFSELLELSEKYKELSGGAFDVYSGPLFDLWGFGFTKDTMPSADRINAVLASCGMGRMKADILTAAQDGTISSADLLKKPSAELPRLNFNAIAQGYSCDVVAAYLYGLGVKDMLVDIGEIFCDGVNPGGKPWRVGVDRPFDGNNDPGTDLDGIWESQNAPCGIVTSGNYRKFYVHDGKKYAHTIDPRTGYPVQHNLLSATIVAKDATDADAYATYCMVIGLDKAKEFIERSPDDLAGYLIYADENGEMHEWASANFNLSKR